MDRKRVCSFLTCVTMRSLLFPLLRHVKLSSEKSGFSNHQKSHLNTNLCDDISDHDHVFTDFIAKFTDEGYVFPSYAIARYMLRWHRITDALLGDF